MALGRFKRRQYFVSKWFVNLHLTVIFIVPIDVVTCIYMQLMSIKIGFSFFSAFLDL